MSIFKKLTIEELENHFSQFLINSWSYSKVTAFARNEKAFEMRYIFGLYTRRAPSTVAGEAYHEALEYYFSNKKDGKLLQITELEAAAYQYIDDLPGNVWKLGVKCPDVDSCKAEATKLVSQLLRNFFNDILVYEEDIDEILFVEVNGSEFVTINGVDIPLPLNFKIDLVFKSKRGSIVILDHKSKRTFSTDEEISMKIGVQAITYVKGFEAMTGIEVNEVWFVENKYSMNKDKSPQLSAFKLVLDENIRRLYEALAYEPIKRTIQAVSDPDYVYLINDSDSFTDMAELYDHWARTMISEVEDFNVEDSKKSLIANRLRKIRDSSLVAINPTIIKNFRQNAAKFIPYDLNAIDMTYEQKIEHALRSFGVIVEVAHKFSGYSSNTYLLSVSAGVKISSIGSRRLDIANALDVENVRVSSSLVKYQDKSYLAIDFAKKRETDLLFTPEDLRGLKIPIGRDNFGEVVFWDLGNHSTPHVLVCGATGSGKSVSLISTIEYCKLSDEVSDIVIFDPKYEFESLSYGEGKVLVITELEEIEATFARLVEVMNERIKNKVNKITLVVFDEFADALAQGSPDLEKNLRILLQKGRSCGFRIIVGTQRASTKVITGDAKVNFPVMICYRVPREVDSRVVLDEPGAEALTGRGDGLIKSPEYNQLVRFQAYYKPV